MKNTSSLLRGLAAAGVLILVGAGCTATTSLEADVSDTSSDQEASVDGGGRMHAQATPESTVDAFYQAFQSNPESALQYVDPDIVNTEDFQEAWNEFKNWKVSDVEVLDAAGNYVEVRMTISAEGDVETGTDEMEVVQKDELWWVVDIPR